LQLRCCAFRGEGESGRDEDVDLVVGLDVEWPCGRVADVCQPPLPCLSDLQICHADYVPIVLARFLADSRFTFVRVGVRVGADKLCAGYGLEVGNAADLHGLTKMLSPDRDVSSMMSSSELGNSTGLVQWCH
jgi:hypothetical protein